MTERGRVVTERALEAACNNLIDIEPNALSEGNRHQNASQDIAKQPSSEKKDIPRLADPPSSKGNKLNLRISVCCSVNESAFVNSLKQEHQASNR